MKTYADEFNVRLVSMNKAKDRACFIITSKDLPKSRSVTVHARPDKHGFYWTDRDGVAIDRIA